MKLIIGDKLVSSWSLRPWLLMKYFDIPFEEVVVSLGQADTKVQIQRYSPSGRVPALIDGELRVWDSLSILEYLNDKFPDRAILPEDENERAWCRSICAEMHSGFLELRAKLSFRLDPVGPGFDVGSAQQDIDRIQEIWTECLEYSGGPFLFGNFSMADAMYAPVAVGRFVPYGVKREGVVAQYCRHMLSIPALKNWIADAYAH